MPWTGWPAPLASRCPQKPCLPWERKAAEGPGTAPPGLLRRREGSVPVEFFQDRRVGVFKQPLLGERRGVTGVHEDPVVTFTAVHAAAADRVVQGLVLGNRGAVSLAAPALRPEPRAAPPPAPSRLPGPALPHPWPGRGEPCLVRCAPHPGPKHARLRPNFTGSHAVFCLFCFVLMDPVANVEDPRDFT